MASLLFIPVAFNRLRTARALISRSLLKPVFTAFILFTFILTITFF